MSRLSGLSDVSGSTIDSFSKCSEDRNSLDDLTDQQLINLIHLKDAECRHLKLENKMFMNFLKANDPAGIDGLETILKFVGKPPGERKASRMPSHLLSSHSVANISSRMSCRLDSVTSISSIAEGRGPKINLSQKTDMLVHAMEDTQSSLESFTKQSYKTKRKLTAQLEEYSLRESDLREAREIFEFSVVTQGYDPLTQRIPAEKFLRYMEEWLRSAQLSIQKLRLRTTTLKQLYKKVSATLVQRRELGEDIRPVDFIQLKIENKSFRDKIDEKSIHLLDLEKMNGGASLVLTKYKKYLQKQEQECKKVKGTIADKQKLIVETEEESKKKKTELDKAYESFERNNELKNNYRVPEVIEYVKIKSQLYDIKNNIKVWERRKKIQDITLNACIRQMKNITGRSKVDPAWLEEMAAEEVYSDEC